MGDVGALHDVGALDDDDAARFVIAVGNETLVFAEFVAFVVAVAVTVAVAVPAVGEGGGGAQRGAGDEGAENFFRGVHDVLLCEVHVSFNGGMAALLTRAGLRSASNC